MIICPSSVKVDGTSTETNPVTHVALVAVNSASIHEIPWQVARGNISNPAPIKMMTKKLEAKMSEGLVRLPSKRTKLLDNCNNEYSNKMPIR